MTTKVEISKIEAQRGGRLLFNVRAYTTERRMEFPIAIQDLGSSSLNETAVLRAALDLAEQLAVSLRLRLAPSVGALAR